jgi:cell wall-associated protease
LNVVRPAITGVIAALAAGALLAGTGAVSQAASAAVIPALEAPATVTATPAQVLAAAPSTGSVTVSAQVVDGTGAHVVSRTARDKQAAAALVRQEQALPGVQAVAVDQPVSATDTSAQYSAQSSAQYSDPYRAEQYALTTLHAEAVDARVDASSEVVAVLDTGVAASQEDLAGVLLPGADFADDAATADPAGTGLVDPNGHGTHVAGIIAADQDNGVDTAGLAHVKILSVRVLDSAGSGSATTVANGIDWAVDHGARVISMSLGGSYTALFETAVQYATAHDVVVVAAAGNTGTTGDAPQYPGATPGVLAVAATDSTNKVANFSTTGSYVGIAAPGVGIVSLSHTGGVVTMSGTSMATPFVAASAALARAAHPSYSEGQIVSLLEQTATPLGAQVPSSSYGYGLVNPYKAVTGFDYGTANSTPSAGGSGGGANAGAGGGTGAGASAGGGTVPVPAPFTAGTVRIAGADRLSTAVDVSNAAFQSAGSADAVVLARSDDFADALAGGPLAAAVHGPLLMTSTNSLDPRVAAEITRVLPTGDTVYILGGTASLSASVAAEVTSLGYAVQRLAGPDRYATALAVADALGDPPTVFLASGTSFADALSAGDAAASQHGALLLAAGSTMPAATASYLSAHAGTVYAIGGPAGRADSAAQPIVGTDRYDTAVRVAQTFFPSATIAGLASGVSFPDALAAGPHLASIGSPLLLSAPTTLPGTVDGFLTAHAVTAVWIFGGPASIGSGVESAVHQLLSAG